MNRLHLADNKLGPWLHTHLKLISGVSISLIVFLNLAKNVWLQQTFAWDLPIILALHSVSCPWLDTLMLIISESADTLAVLFVLALAVWFWIRKRRVLAVTLPASFGGAGAINTLLKLIFARPRPIVFTPLVSETDYSFPSGHVAAAMAFYGLLAILLWRRQHEGWAVVCGLWVVAVGISRIYLGVHYPSDVVASFVFGLIWLSAVLTIHDWALERYQLNSKPQEALSP